MIIYLEKFTLEFTSDSGPVTLECVLPDKLEFKLTLPPASDARRRAQELLGQLQPSSPESSRLLETLNRALGDEPHSAVRPNVVLLRNKQRD